MRFSNNKTVKMAIYTVKLRKLDVDIVKRDFNVFVILLLSLT